MTADKPDTTETVYAAARNCAATILDKEEKVVIVLFGSRAAGTHKATSDFDIGIDVGHPLEARKMDLLRDYFDILTHNLTKDGLLLLPWDINQNHKHCGT